MSAVSNVGWQAVRVVRVRVFLDCGCMAGEFDKTDTLPELGDDWTCDEHGDSCIVWAIRLARPGRTET